MKVCTQVTKLIVQNNYHAAKNFSGCKCFRPQLPLLKLHVNERISILKNENENITRGLGGLILGGMVTLLLPLINPFFFVVPVGTFALSFLKYKVSEAKNKEIESATDFITFCDNLEDTTYGCDGGPKQFKYNKVC